MPIDQRDIIAFLLRPETHGLRHGGVQRVDTHISVVFLAGPRAYKLKRAVTFPYLDYSSLDLRRRACEREVQLNRRTAPHIYRAVVAVTREHDGRMAIGGLGEAIEWLVEMMRFDDDLLLDRLAERHQLPVEIVAHLGQTVAAFHEHALPRRDFGGASSLWRVVDGNTEEMLADRSGVLDPAACSELHKAAATAIGRHGVLLEARRVHGLVRQCHGDLHLHNVVLANGVPTLFDAIEFNDDFACIDVMYDLAFLLMDLVHRDLPAHANAALNAYLENRPDYAALALLPLFLSCRAAVRAKVSVSEAAVQPDASRQAAYRAEAREYLRLARALLDARRASLIAIGGLSGSGKSTLARALAPGVGATPGAVVIRSDVIRKRMFGVEVSHRLPDSAYDAETTARVYARALHTAEACLRAGQSAILDAVFGDPRHREAVERLAAEAGVPFNGLWLEVPSRVAAERLRARPVDASDADERVLAMQLERDVGEIRWMPIDASSGAAQVADVASRLIGARTHPAPILSAR